MPDGAVYGAVGHFTGTVNFTGRQAVRWPHRVGAVPRLAHHRQRRSADDVLAAAATGGGTAVVCQVVAGMGGVGKTQLTVNLAEELWQTRAVDLLIWVTASSRDSVVNTYAQAAADISGAADPDRLLAADRLLAWLAGTDKRWMVVLDDVSNPQDLAGLWPPDTAFGRTVVTSRRRDTALLDGRRLVDVGVFTHQEAVDYLRGRLGDSPHLLDESDQLAADLGRLPLALAQAVVYVRDQDLTCAGYRQRLRRRRLDRLLPAVLPDGQQQAVSETWGLSIELADSATDGLAGIVLQLAAVLDPNGVPVTVFTTSAALGHYRNRLPADIDGDDAHDAVRVLYRLGLADTTATADPDGSEGVLRVHALVQRVVREATPAGQQPALAHTAADALLQLWPDIERDPATTRLGQLLRANTTALTAVIGDHLWAALDLTANAHAVLFRAGTSLGEIGLVAAARDHFHRLHAESLRLLGSDHRDTLSARNNFARWRGEAGDPAGAATAFRDLLADRVRVLGPDHLQTLNTRSGLARWRGEAGDPVGAATAYEELLKDRVRVLGPGHPDILGARHGLAYWRGMAGDSVGAAAAFQELLTDHQRVHGPNHPDTLGTRGNLAHHWGEAGDPTKAATAYQYLLNDRVRLLGPDHPDTLTTRHNLARWLGKAGDPAGAAMAYRELLPDVVRVLGPDHPDTLSTRSNFARWRGAAGDPAGAAMAYRELLPDVVRVLGPDHPQTLIVRNNFARWQGKAGNPAEAATAYMELLLDVVRVLGSDHPDTQTVLGNLVFWQDKTDTSYESPPADDA